MPCVLSETQKRHNTASMARSWRSLVAFIEGAISIITSSERSSKFLISRPRAVIAFADTVHVRAREVKAMCGDGVAVSDVVQRWRHGFGELAVSVEISLCYLARATLGGGARGGESLGISLFAWEKLLCYQTILARHKMRKGENMVRRYLHKRACCTNVDASAPRADCRSRQ